MLSRRRGGLEYGANHVLRFLRAYASLDTSRRKGLARAMKWNDIPYDASASGEVKGLEFDLQVEENGGDSTVTHQNPYPEEEND